MAEHILIAAPAKLNLILRVGPPGADGYHPIASLMVALDGLEDEVRITRSDARTLICPGAPAGPANLAWRALDALEAYVGRSLPAEIRITKRIPMQAGLGGGSSDAAAVLVGADRVFGLGVPDDALETIGATLGSDVPFFIRGGTQWVTGRGERLTPQGLPERLWALICGPVAALSTAAVYGQFDLLGGGTGFDDAAPPAPWTPGSPTANDLWPAASALAPALGQAAARLRAAGADEVLLCGSGGAIAGLWHAVEPARAAARSVAGALAVVRPRPARGPG